MLSSIIKKEIKELLTASTIISIVVVAIMFGSIGQMVGETKEQVKEPPKIGIVDLDKGNYSNVAMLVVNAQSKVVYNGTNVDEGVKKVAGSDGLALLVIPSNFTSDLSTGKRAAIEVHWIMKGTGATDSVQSANVEGLIFLINNELSKVFIVENSSNDPNFVLNPIYKTETTYINGRAIKDTNPIMLSSMLATQTMLVPIVIMMLIMMAGGSVISSMGMEKENKTLETLLTLPVKRSYIVAGKLIGSAVVGLLMAVIYMCGFGYYMNSLTSSEMSLSDYGLELGAFDYILVGLSLFASLIAGLSMCMVLGTFAKNYKSAQTLTFPISALAMFPMFVVMFRDISTVPTFLQVILYAIPFTHPMIAMQSLMFDNYLLVVGGIIYSSIFATVMMGVAVWIFKTDRVITGKPDTGKKNDLIALLLSRRK